jgi:uncharacterized protein
MLKRELRAWPTQHSAGISVTETIRTLRRNGRAEALKIGRELLDTIDLIVVDRMLLERAASVDPPMLRSLDAIHLAAALAIGEDLGAFVTYDVRLADAARANNLTVISPGADPPRSAGRLI